MTKNQSSAFWRIFVCFVFFSALFMFLLGGAPALSVSTFVIFGAAYALCALLLRWWIVGNSELVDSWFDCQ